MNLLTIIYKALLRSGCPNPDDVIKTIAIYLDVAQDLQGAEQEVQIQTNVPEPPPVVDAAHKSKVIPIDTPRKPKVQQMSMFTEEPLEVEEIIPVADRALSLVNVKPEEEFEQLVERSQKGLPVEIEVDLPDGKACVKFQAVHYVKRPSQGVPHVGISFINSNGNEISKTAYFTNDKIDINKDIEDFKLSIGKQLVAMQHAPTPSLKIMSDYQDLSKGMYGGNIA